MLTLTATDTYDNKAQTVVTIYLPETNQDAPVFSEIVYMAVYTFGTADANLAIEKDIVISNRDDPSLITITLNCKYIFAGSLR